MAVIFMARTSAARAGGASIGRDNDVALEWRQEGAAVGTPPQQSYIIMPVDLDATILLASRCCRSTSR